MVPSKSSKTESNQHDRECPQRRRAQVDQDADPAATNTLYLVLFADYSKGFMARSKDCASRRFFDLDGTQLSGEPRLTMVVRSLGDYAPGDEDGFWALVALV